MTFISVFLHFANLTNFIKIEIFKALCSIDGGIGMDIAKQISLSKQNIMIRWSGIVTIHYILLHLAFQTSSRSRFHSRGGAVLIALASHRYGPWVEFVVGSCPCSEGFLRVLRFSSLH